VEKPDLNPKVKFACWICVRVTQKADLAAAPLTVNIDREHAVQFLNPALMNFDLAMLMRKRHKSSDVQSICGAWNPQYSGR